MNNKLALLIGINYKNTESQLNGCINDVLNIKNTLINKFNYHPNNIILLTDDTYKKPTINNILYSIYQLLIKCYRNRNINEVWFHYSGHGSYLDDTNNDEQDNKDECIIPLDYERNGIITDDILYKYFRWFPSRVNIISIFDCCHSGTIMDLEYKYNYEENKLIKENNKRMDSKILCFSGCKDNQTSMESLNFYENGKYNGVLTSTLIMILEKNNYNISIINLLYEIKKYILENNFEQIPILTCSFNIEINDMFCINGNSFIH